jgi:hypothetical protein
VLLRSVWSLTTDVIDVMPGTFLVGVGAGLSLGPVSNLIMSAAAEQQEADASGVMNVAKSLGNSFGVAVIALLILVNTFVVLPSAVAHSYVGEAAPAWMGEAVGKWLATPESSVMQTAREQHDTLAMVINETISKAMQGTIDGLLVIVAAGFVCSLFLRPKATKGQMKKLGY